MNITSDSGWLTENGPGKTVDINESDLEDLLQLAELDDKWADNVKKEVLYHDKQPHSGNRAEIFIDYFRTMNTGGTMVQFPFGYICTFPSRKHLFRGEIQDYPHTESSLSRRCRDKNGKRRSQRETELLHILANMRVIQFQKFVWQFDIVPQWEGKLSDVNYKALAQHYGFETFLLDLTNDVRSALFFATCKWVTDHFEPLTQADIDKTAGSQYGIIYHAPDWWLDFMNGGAMRQYPSIFTRVADRKKPCIIDAGQCDGLAFQIGLQPFARVYSQSGYVYPMKTLEDVKESGQFERLRFRQNVDFSKRMYNMMDGGKRLYPDEGVTAVLAVFAEMQKNYVFSEDDLVHAYEIEEADRTVFPNMETLRNTLLSDETCNLIKDVYNVDHKIVIQAEEVEYPVSQDIKDYVNSHYNDRPFLEPVGGILHETADSHRYRRERYKQIYGEYPK